MNELGSGVPLSYRFFDQLPSVPDLPVMRSVVSFIPPAHRMGPMWTGLSLRFDGKRFFTGDVRISPLTKKS